MFLWFSTFVEYQNQLDHLNCLLSMLCFLSFLSESKMQPSLKKHCVRKLFQLVGMP